MQDITTSNQDQLDHFNFNSDVHETQNPVDAPLIITEADIDELLNNFIQ